MACLHERANQSARVLTSERIRLRECAPPSDGGSVVVCRIGRMGQPLQRVSKARRESAVLSRTGLTLENTDSLIEPRKA
jgi:hypothetical protein